MGVYHYRVYSANPTVSKLKILISNTRAYPSYKMLIRSCFHAYRGNKINNKQKEFLKVNLVIAPANWIGLIITAPLFYVNLLVIFNIGFRGVINPAIFIVLLFLLCSSVFLGHKILTFSINIGKLLYKERRFFKNVRI